MAMKNAENDENDENDEKNDNGKQQTNIKILKYKNHRNNDI